MTRQVIVITLLIVLAAGSWYVARNLQKDEQVTETGDVLQSGFYLRSARIFGTDENGEPLFRIEAEYAEQQENEEVELRNVEINYTSESRVPWRLNADRAVVGYGRDSVTLSGHVTAISNEGFSGDVTEIRTDVLELEPQQFRAETDERVQIRIGSRSITAVGMYASLQSNQLRLKSNVSGKFAPY